MEPSAESRLAALGWSPTSARVSLDAGRLAAISEVWRAFWMSRALVWGVGVVAVLLTWESSLGNPRLDPLWTTAPFTDDFLNAVVSPAARFDSAWLLEIADHGYAIDARTAFFPLYPMLVAALAAVTGGSTLVAGIAVSVLCSLAALYLLHRLVALDHGLEVARTTVWIVACFPLAFCLSAVYTESLFLLLSVGSLYAARLGNWPAACACAGLAAGTRSAGILLVLPLLVVMLYGPRADRAAAGLRLTMRDLRKSWRPRYRLGREALWLGLVPLGLVSYLAFLGIATGDPFATFAAQGEWSRIFAPFAGIALGIWWGLVGIWELLPGFGMPDGAMVGGSAPEQGAVRNIVNLLFLASACWLLVQVARRLAPGDFVCAFSSLALPLSVPAGGNPLLSFPRFMLVVYPLWIALAIWAVERDATRRVLLALSALLAAATALFVGWAVAP
jgi:Mannosyltransferase (PIG-V)